MEELIVVSLLKSLPAFFQWAFPLNLAAAMSLAVGMAAEWAVLRKNGKWWVLPLVFLGATFLLEVLWQTSVGMEGMIFPVCGFFTLLILAGSLLSLILYKLWTKVCDLCP